LVGRGTEVGGAHLYDEVQAAVGSSALDIPVFHAVSEAMKRILFLLHVDANKCLCEKPMIITKDHLIELEHGTARLILACIIIITITTILREYNSDIY